MSRYPIVFGICWTIFWLYWIMSAFWSKKSTSLHITEFIRIRIAIFVLAVMLVQFGHHLPQSFKHYFPSSNGTILALGFMVFLLGLILAVWARIYLGKNWGMPMTQKQDPELVTSGPYRYIRHPIYSGILLMALSSAVDVNMYWLLVFIIAAMYFVYSSITEEKLMLKQFPKVYPAYKNKTKMLIPFIL